MHGRSSRRLNQSLTALALVLMLVGITACSERTPDGSVTEDPGTDTTPSTPGATPDSGPDATIGRKTAEEIVLSPAETAAALRDPDRAEEGVWSVLANLNISVYEFSGEAVLPGSAIGPEDYWINAFQVPLLVEMTQQGSIPFDIHHEYMTQFGLEVTPEELGAEYATVYESVADEWLPSLFRELGLDFSTQPSVTPFEQWLLFLDAYVPLRNTAEVQATGGVTLLAPANPTAVLTGLGEECIWMPEGANTGNWGWVYSKAGSVKGFIDAARGAAAAGKVTLAMVILNAAPDVANAMITQTLIELTVTVDSGISHERHSDGLWLNTPDEVRIEASASFVADVPAEVRCAVKAITGVDIKDVGAKNLEGMQVRWTFSDVFGEHGSFEVVDDTNGDNSYEVNHLDDKAKQAILYVSPKKLIVDRKGQEATGFDKTEPGGALAPSDETGTIEAWFLINMDDIFNLFADAASVLFPRVEYAQVLVQWHEPWMEILNVTDLTEFWSGANVTELRTCDGTAWDGSMELSATADSGAGTLRMTSDTPIQFTMPAGADSIEVPLNVITDLSGEVNGATVTNTINMTANLKIEFDFRAGTADLTLETTGGTQDVDVVAPRGSGSGSGGVDPSSITPTQSSATRTVNITQAEGCDG